MYCCHLFLISSASVKSIPFLFFIVPICMRYSLGISNFPEETSSLSHSIVFLYFFALITEEGFFYLSLLFFGTLHSDGYIFPLPLCLLLLFFSQLCVRPPQTTVLPFAFLFLGMVLITASCTVSWTSIHIFSGTLSIRTNPLNLYGLITSFQWRSQLLWSDSLIS